jgi:hypothetical protein
VPALPPEPAQRSAPPALGDQLSLAAIGGAGNEDAKDNDARPPTRNRWAWLFAHVFRADLDTCPRFPFTDPPRAAPATVRALTLRPDTLTPFIEHAPPCVPRALGSTRIGFQSHRPPLAVHLSAIDPSEKSPLAVHLFGSHDPPVSLPYTPARLALLRRWPVFVLRLDLAPNCGAWPDIRKRGPLAGAHRRVANQARHRIAGYADGVIRAPGSHRDSGARFSRKHCDTPSGRIGGAPGDYL